MLQLNFFREQKDRVIIGFKKRNWSDEEIENVLNQVSTVDDARRASQTELDSLLAEINQLSKKIGELMESGQRTEGEAMKSQIADLKENAKVLEDKKNDAEKYLENLLLTLPNIPNEAVPFGKSADDNEVTIALSENIKADIHTNTLTKNLEHDNAWQSWISILPMLPISAQPHWELAQKYNVFDLELGVKITGAGFPVFRGKGAKLVRALIQFFLDEAQAAEL